jgi:hypothetical protein
MGVSRMTRPVKILVRGRQPGQAATMPMPRGAGYRLLARPNRWRWPLALLGATQNDRSRTGATPPPDARDERITTVIGNPVAGRGCPITASHNARDPVAPIAG